MLNILSFIVLSAINPSQSIPVLNTNYAPRGAGVLLSPTTVLTAAHVVDDKEIYYVQCDGQPVKVKKIEGDKEADLALLTLNKACNEPVSKLAIENESLGNRIFGIGCPSGMCGMITSGIVSMYQFNSDKHLRLISDTKIWFGNSGGPLLNEDGELIGICTQIAGWSRLEIDPPNIRVTAQTYSLWIPTSEIRQFLKEIK